MIDRLFGDLEKGGLDGLINNVGDMASGQPGVMEHIEPAEVLADSRDGRPSAGGIAEIGVALVSETEPLRHVAELPGS